MYQHHILVQFNSIYSFKDAIYVSSKSALHKIKIIISKKLILIKIKNYVFDLIDFTSVAHDLGSQKIFLLLSDTSHNPHFLACQNMETQEQTQKISNFYLYRFFRYSTPNMALQNIILTSFFFVFVFCFSSSQSRAMRSPNHNFSKILSNQNEISQTCSGVNVVDRNTIWVHSVQGFRS